MKTLQNLTFLLIIATFMSCKTKPVDCKPFDKLNIKENCSIYFILFEGDRGDFEKANMNFVITDKREIQKLKDTWGFYKTDDRMPCGFGFVVFIIQNGEFIEEIAINEPCGYAVISEEWYDFDKSFLDNIDITKIEKLNKQQSDSIQKAFFNHSIEKNNKR
jgi:hypothetical protein